MPYYDTMYNTIYSKGSIPLLEQMLYMTSARHEVIAGNIANAETYNYKAKDINSKSFMQMLGDAYFKAQEKEVPTVQLQKTDDTTFRANFPTFRPYDVINPLKHNGNTVDIDLEMANLSRNSGLHNIAANLLNHQFTMLRETIAERTIG